MVRDISPFHRALNYAADQVRTDFFLQVDCDMILARHCIADLRSAMTANVGITMGALTDPLMGVISGVKMFRTEVFSRIRFRDTVSPDRDFYRNMENLGYRWIDVLGRSDSPMEQNAVWHCCGRHEPDYSPLYTFAKYRLLGRRYRSWRDLPGLQWRFRRLGLCTLDAALIAQVAMGHGIFSRDCGDGLRPYARSRDFDFLMEFLGTDRPSLFPGELPAGLLSGTAERDFQRCYELAETIADKGSPRDLKRMLPALHAYDEDSSWTGKVGLCHGLFASVTGNDKADAIRALAEFPARF